MLKKIFGYFMLPLLLLLTNSSGNSAPQLPEKSADAQTGTLEKLIVAHGSVAMDLDLNRLNGTASGTRESKPETLRFQVGPNSFFTILVFNDALRGPEAGTMGLIPEGTATLPGPLQTALNQLVIEKLSSDAPFDLAVRDGKTGFVFFNIEGHLYEYDAAAHLLSIKDGRLLISEEFANRLGRSAEAGAIVGKISISTTMYPIEISTVVNGAVQSSVLPARGGGAPDVPNFVPGPDVIVGDLPSMAQFGVTGTQVGLGVGTTSCNNGNVQLNWFQMPNTDHPVIPQNFYRMSGGATNDERFEQIGQSWLKHAFTALQQDACLFGCTSSGTGTRLGVGCSDPYGASLNASQSGLGSRAWVNPFTGAYPSTARDHTGHSDSSSTAVHRLRVEMNDLNTTMNPGATYYAEAQYVTPHEYAWCQANPGQCNMYNNVSYRRFNVAGTTSFSFSAVGSTVRTTPAINVWPGATINTIEPVPGTDGRAFIAYKVTNPSAGVWHYEYAINNQNLDRGIQSFSVPLGNGITVSNLGFHAPPNHPGIANDGTQSSAGYSNTAWASSQTSVLTWSSETFAQNENANAIRWGTLYNFRFDSNRPPQPTNATIGFFKTGTPITVGIQGPSPDGGATPTPTPPTTPTPTPTPPTTPTPTPTPPTTPTPTATVTPSATPSATPCATRLSENFDEWTPPLLPPGWVPTNTTGPAPLWVTSPTTPDSPPNHAFIDDPATVSDKVLATPNIAISSASAKVNFRHNFDLQDARDGAVLEVSSPNINTGAFTDITNAAVGGSFVTGGYTDTISTGFGSPIAGRMAWSGLSGGYITTIANLGPNVAGQTIKLRFRMASDNSVAGVGWRVDSISVVEGPCPSPTPPPTPTPTPPIPTPTPSGTPIPSPSEGPRADIAVFIADSPDPVQVGQNLTYTITVSNGGPNGPASVGMSATFPASANFVSVTPSQGSCSSGTSGVSCGLGSLSAGSSATVTLVVTPTEAGPISNSASVASSCCFLDPFQGNNFDTESTTVLPAGTPTPTPTTPTPTPGASPTPGAQPLNLSTRMRIQTGDNVGIGGFIITGTAPKHVLLRAIGPSLTQFGVPNALADPVLELHGPAPFATINNDNWRDDPVQQAAILATGIAPTDNLEAAIDATLNPGAYTAVVRGKNNTSGVGLIEVYDLSQSVLAKLANISTRALIDTGDNVVIAGFILGNHSGQSRIALRGIGPSLTALGVTNALANPTLELRDGNGALLMANNDWQDNPAQMSELMGAGLAPANPLESGIAAALPPGLYTVVLAGLNNGTGVGLVEAYDLGPP